MTQAYAETDDTGHRNVSERVCTVLCDHGISVLARDRLPDSSCEHLEWHRLFARVPVRQYRPDNL